MTAIRDTLAAARCDVPVAEARLLLRHALGRSHAWLEAHGEESLTDTERERFTALHTRRLNGEPIAYLLGRREFYGRMFEVAPGVLIPRPETELLVDKAVTRLAGCQAPRIVDLGTGSGCLAVTLALELPSARVTAVELSSVALEIARRNAREHDARVGFVQGDWLAAFDNACFELVVANPPYVAAGDPHLAMGDLRFEPKLALVGGTDGLAAIRAIVSETWARLAPGGWLLLEHGYDQGDAVADLLVRGGYAQIEQACDLSGVVRVSGGCKDV